MALTEAISNNSNVAVIPATRRSVQSRGQLKEQTGIRVAAYCRVSTGDESQQTSYTNQKAFYSELIRSRQGWEFAGIYADEAISGTSRARRREFNRMMEDAKSGRLDYIVTKSISRFARNTVDTLNCVRELRQINPPVGIYFEKENIDTLDAAGELILTILSALAQDESRSISDNIRWTFRKNFQAGIPQINLNRMIGYDKDQDGTWVINPKQAVTVRYIFEHYVRGSSANRIARELNEKGCRTVNEKSWTCNSVLTVLRNEKYVGDLEMQKTITKDFLNHRSVVNNGEAPKYYVRNHHVGIIDRVTWEKVQSMLHGRNRKENERIRTGPKGSPFFNLRCGRTVSDTDQGCGKKLSRMTYTRSVRGYSDQRSLAATGGDLSRYSEKYFCAYPVWRCRRKGKEKSCPSVLFHECALEQSFMELLYGLKRDFDANGEESSICSRFREACARTCKRMKGNLAFGWRMEMLEDQICELEEQLEKIGAEHGASPGSAPGQTSRRNGKAAEDLVFSLEELRREKETLEAEQQVTVVMRKNFDFFLRCLKELPEENGSGDRLMVNGLDTAETPDFLLFERGIYTAFIESGAIQGDTVTYTTNFGVKLWTTGNKRTPDDFIGFRKCRDDGTVEIVEAPYQVYGNRIQYRRYLRKGADLIENARTSSAAE